jgi:hypothetical protein
VTRLSGSLRLLHPQLAEIVFQFEDAQARLHRLEARTPDDRWRVRSQRDSWSIGECISHLNLTSKAYIPLLREAFEKDNRVHKAPKRYHRDPVGWLTSTLVGEQGGPARRLLRLRTPPRFVPAPATSLDREMVVAEFNTYQHELVMLTHLAEQREIQKLRIVSPFNPRVSYNVYSCLVLLPRHQHRHLAQAERVWQAETQAT